MVLSSTRIVQRLDEVDERAIAGAARGLNLAAVRLLALATPLTPYLDGTLQNGYGIHTVVATRASVEEGAQLQNATVYAAYHHEGGDATRSIDESHRARNQHPGATSKFVEKPMRANRDELYGLIAQAVKEALE